MRDEVAGVQHRFAVRRASRQEMKISERDYAWAFRTLDVDFCFQRRHGYAHVKREPGSGCPAITGSNRTLAILGASEHCIATNPSDMCVAMAALEAKIYVQGSKGPRVIAFADFHLLPGSTPQRETVLEPGDLITHVTLPPPIAGSKQLYLKLRDRASYEFALASAAVVLTITSGKITRARIALGGVGTKPWRSPEAGVALTNTTAHDATLRQASKAASRGAKTP